MSFNGSNVNPDKKTGFTYEGKEIVLSKTMGRPMGGIATRVGWYPDEKRIEVATLFAVTGSKKAVSEYTGVPASTIGNWLKEDWFKQLLEDIRAENDHIIDSKATEVIVLSLEKLKDRIENGDFVVHRNKDGEATLVRKPVSARDLSIVQAINLDKRQLLRGKPTSRNEQVTNQGIQDKLNQLAETFRQVAGKPAEVSQDITDVEYQEVK